MRVEIELPFASYCAVLGWLIGSKPAELNERVSLSSRQPASQAQNERDRCILSLVCA